MTEITDRDHELYNKAVTNDHDGRQMLLAIAAAREEGRQEERARWREWLDRTQMAQELDIEEGFDSAPDKRGVAG